MYHFFFSYVYFQIRMEIFIVEPTEEINVVEGSLDVKEEPEDDPLAGKDIQVLLGLWLLRIMILRPDIHFRKLNPVFDRISRSYRIRYIQVFC